MIFYATKETFNRYGLNTPEEQTNPELKATMQDIFQEENGDHLLEWGGKLFYFRGKKCLQIVNFASKLTLILADVKKNDINHLDKMITGCLLQLYRDNPKMINFLGQYVKEHLPICFDRLKDRSIISTLNSTESAYLWYGDKLKAYMNSEDTVNVFDLNKIINYHYLFAQTTDKKTEYYYPAKQFELLMQERYS